MSQLFRNLVKARFNQNHRSTEGMTLLEVLAVIIIISILAALVAPGWLTFVNRQRAASAQDQILQALRDTQAQARRTRENRTLTLITNDGGLPEIEVQGQTRVSLGQGDLEPRMLSLSIFEGGTAVPDGAFEIQFAPNGGLNVDDQNLDLPVILSAASPDNSATQRCVILETLLGATRIGRDDECNPPG